MKVILLQDVAKTGLKHDSVEVSNGYALNQLIPKGLAIPATPDNQKKMKHELEKREKANVVIAQAYSEAASSLANKAVIVKVEVNEKGHMFEALKVEMIVDAARADDIVVMADMIELDKPIKQVGEYTLMLSSGTDKQPFVLKVESK